MQRSKGPTTGPADDTRAVTGTRGPGEPDQQPNGAIAHAWSTLVAARATVEAEATSLRKNLLLTAAVFVLAGIVLDRFRFLSTEVRILLALLPAALSSPAPGSTWPGTTGGTGTW